MHAWIHAHQTYLQAVENNEDNLEDVSGWVVADSKETNDPSGTHQRKKDDKGLHQLATEFATR